MSITSRCKGCGATSLDGVLMHNSGCIATKPKMQHGSIMPATTITFDTPEQQQKFMDGLKGGATGTAVSNTPQEYELIGDAHDMNPTPEEVAAYMRSLKFEWLEEDQQWYKVLPHKVGDFQGKGRGQYVHPELATFFYQQAHPTPPTGDMEELDKLYNPSISDLELHEMRNEECTVVYLESVKALLLALKSEWGRAAREDELNKVDQAYSWGSIVTHDGFKKWRANRMAKLQPPQNPGGNLPPPSNPDYPGPYERNGDG